MPIKQISRDNSISADLLHYGVIGSRLAVALAFTATITVSVAITLPLAFTITFATINDMAWREFTGANARIFHDLAPAFTGSAQRNEACCGLTGLLSQQIGPGNFAEAVTLAMEAHDLAIGHAKRCCQTSRDWLRRIGAISALSCGSGCDRCGGGCRGRRW